MDGIFTVSEEATKCISTPLKKGIVIIAGHRLSDEVPNGTQNSILKQAGLK